MTKIFCAAGAASGISLSPYGDNSPPEVIVSCIIYPFSLVRLITCVKTDECLLVWFGA